MSSPARVIARMLGRSPVTPGVATAGRRGGGGGPPPQTELIKNGNFNAGPEDWATMNVTIPINGAATFTGLGGGTLTQEEMNSATIQGNDYVLFFRITANPNSAGFTIQMVREGGVQALAFAQAYEPDTYTIDFTANNVYPSFRVSADSPDAAIDDISIMPSTP